MAHATPVHAADHGQGDLHVHVMPVSILLGVWAALMVMTVFTFVMSYVSLGPVDIIVVMAVATVKASLVGLYFMHLRYDKPFNAMIFLSSLGFVGLFITLCLMDSSQNQPFINFSLLPNYSGQPPAPTAPEAPHGH
jgi:cytochrome c oxidase subunit 4